MRSHADHSGKAPAAAVATERFEAAGEEPTGSKLWPKAGWTSETLATNPLLARW